MSRVWQRRRFTLIEVLIALLLVTMAMVPLMAPHLRIFQEESRFLDQLRLDRAASLLYAELVEKLYRQELPWQAMESSESFEIEPMKLQQLSGHPLPFRGSYRFVVQKHKPKEKDLFMVYLYRLLFTFSPVGKGKGEICYSYDLFVVRDLRDSKKDEAP